MGQHGQRLNTGTSFSVSSNDSATRYKLKYNTNQELYQPYGKQQTSVLYLRKGKKLKPSTTDQSRSHVFHAS